jgi:hypothetical protein
VLFGAQLFVGTIFQLVAAFALRKLAHDLSTVCFVSPLV